MAIEIIDKIKPKNNGSFPMVDAEDILMPSGKRLSEEIPAVTEEDNGKILMVANGGWGAFSIPKAEEASF